MGNERLRFEEVLGAQRSRRLEVFPPPGEKMRILEMQIWGCCSGERGRARGESEPGGTEFLAGIYVSSTRCLLLFTR